MAFVNQGAKRLRELLADSSNIVAAPGVYDGLTARMALAQGFDCLYMTGAGTSISRLGMADLGLATQTDMVANAAMLASISPSTPLIADADTGYGGPVMVARTVQAYARAGVAGLHIEDQVQEKRCGHLLGKQLVEPEVWYARLRAAVAARKECGSDMVIIARTDANAVLGFEKAVERLKGAIECGVDVLFLEALKDQDECRVACDIFKKMGMPLLLNMVPAGVTPNMSVTEANDLGFRLVIFPAVCLEAVFLKGMEALKHLKEHGKQEQGAVGPKELFELCGLKDLMAIDKNAGGTAYGTI